MNTVINIIGAGAVGHVLFAKLKEKKLSVRLCGREGIVEESNCLKAFETPQNSLSQVFFIATKAYQVTKAIETLKDSRFFYPDADSIIILSNGLPNQVSFKAIKNFPDLKIRSGLVSFGAARSEKTGKYQSTSKSGIIGFGSLNLSLAPISRSEEMLASELPQFIKIFKNPKELKTLLYRKWLFNVSLNLLCAVLELDSNKQALDYPSDLRQLFDEAWELGASIQGAWLDAKETYWQSLITLIRDTAENRNSMRTDMVLNRQTEINELLPENFVTQESRYPHLSKFRQKILLSRMAPSF